MIKRKLFTHFDLSLIISMFVLSVVLTFPSYFFFVPFVGGLNALSVLQALTMAGWISLLVVPPFMLYRDDVIWDRSRFLLFSILVSLWTVSTALIKIYNYANFGAWYADYLWVYKVFILFEWIIPAIYIWLAYDFVEATVKVPKRQRPVRVLDVVQDFKRDDEELVVERRHEEINRNRPLD